MKWLKDFGVSQSYSDYMGLPLAVLEDCRMLMRAEAQVRALQDTKQPTQDLIAKELAERDGE